MERRLAAILAADVVGYSKLMAEDEAGTLVALKAHRKELFDPEIEKRGGRVVKLMGDGALVEFASVVDAVECALAIQRILVEDDGPFTLRIGINLGDVIIDGDDIYGDGVNIAARLEKLAEPGGICLSSVVFESLGNRVDAAFADAGEHAVKNIDKPIRVWKWPDRTAAATGVDSAPSGEANAPVLPDKPSIAVLPLNNMSNDPDQDFLADGIAEDIITSLSKFGSLFVIARNSSFSFKGQQLDVKKIGKRLGVRYVLEGSVRRAGNRARITAQLIDAIEDQHIWAERYDRDLEDIFAVQDEVTLAIVRAIEPRLINSEQQRALRKPPENLDAWENFQRGMWHLLKYSPQECLAAFSFLQRATVLDPNFAAAHACLGYAHCLRVLHDISADPAEDIELALEAGRKAARLDEHEAYAYLTIGRAKIFQRRFDEALAATDQAISINPNFALAHMIRGHGLWHAGRPEEAVRSIDIAIRASPHDPLMWVFLATKAIALVMLKRYDEAILVSRTAQQYPNVAIFAFLGEMSALGHANDMDAATDVILRARAVKPDVSISFVDKVLPVADPNFREIFVGGLRMAGLSV
jgi:adenylate cyclase